MKNKLYVNHWARLLCQGFCFRLFLVFSIAVSVLFCYCTLYFTQDIPLKLFQYTSFLLIIYDSLREKCLYSELFWSLFSRIRTECREIWSISTYSVQILENSDCFKLLHVFSPFNWFYLLIQNNDLSADSNAKEKPYAEDVYKVFWSHLSFE